MQYWPSVHAYRSPHSCLPCFLHSLAEHAKHAELLETEMSPITRPRILVVDNDPLVVTSLGTRLAHRGYFPVPAGTGAQALDVLRFGGIELVITDLHMPVLDGLGLIERIRRNPDTMNLPVVVVTGAETDVCRQLEHAPQLCLIRKPFSFGDLSSICHEMLVSTRPTRHAA